MIAILCCYAVQCFLAGGLIGYLCGGDTNA